MIKKILVASLLFAPLLATAASFNYRVPAKGIVAAPSSPSTPVESAPPPYVSDGTSNAGACASSFATSCVTLNGADKDARLTLSNGDLTFTGDSAPTWEGARATIAKSSGKWYWEVTFATNPQSHHIHGVGTLASPLTFPGGSEASSWGYNGTGYVYHEGLQVLTMTVGNNLENVVGFALDADAGILFVRNSTGTLATIPGLSKGLFPMIGVYGPNSGTINFGQANFTLAVPAGYNAGVW